MNSRYNKLTRGFLLTLISFWMTVMPAGAKQTTTPLPLAAPQVHEKKVYVSEKSTIFWPMALPVWIRLATSPREDAPSFLLQNLHEGKEDAEEKYRRKGIKLEIPGRQFVRWVNYLTEDEELYKFIADGSPPETTLKLHSTPVFKGRNQVFYGVGLRGSLTSGDDLSGVRETYYSIDGKKFERYSRTLKLDQEKPYHIRYYAVDRVGYAAVPKTEQFMVDLTPPESAHRTVDNFLKDTLSRQTIIRLSSRDQLSGVDNIRFGFDNSTRTEIYDNEKGILLADLKDGLHTLHYSATDRVRNRETEKRYSFHLDLTPPLVSYTIIGDLFPRDGSQYVSPRTRIQFNASDDQVPLNKIQYKINKGAFNKYVNPFIPPIKPGPFLVQYRAIDELKNQSVLQNLEMLMDIEGPVSKMRLIGAHFSQGGGVIWITDQTLIEISSKDDSSGLQKIEYQFADQPTTIYSKPIRIENEGQNLFRYWGTDQVNNREMFSPVLLMVDKTPPRVLEVFSIDPVKTVKNKEGKTVHVYPVHTSLFLSAMDNSASVKGLWYSLNDEPMKKYDQILFFSKPGKFKIRIKAEDRVGNVTIQSSEFLITGNP